ncbi:MAG TPA: methyltransferase domain-containing protein [Stellaceae bacterium]|nr:methyltransferase domain-containing protein [Stellaceae bacterium]
MTCASPGCPGFGCAAYHRDIDLHITVNWLAGANCAARPATPTRPLASRIYSYEYSELIKRVGERNAGLTGDATALAFPAESFDGAYSLLALNFMSDPGGALAGMRRVVRAGGVVAAAVWDFSGGLVYQRMFWDTAAALDLAAERARARHYSSPLTGPGQLTAAFAAAGLDLVEGCSLTIRMKYRDFPDYWEPIANGQGPVGDYIKGLAPDRLAALAAAV